MTGGPREGVVAGDGLGDGVGFDPQADESPNAGLKNRRILVMHSFNVYVYQNKIKLRSMFTTSFL